ncbi:MAG: hypothetical protein IIY93_08535 [Clostridia bacterium]|nr:hypothetical protein [Clostridia bacterium]
MKCFKCGSDNTIHVDFDDGTEMLQCNNCGAKMTISQPPDNLSASILTVPIVAAVDPAKKSIVNKDVIMEKCQVLKNWVMNPISMTSTVLNGALLVISIVLLVSLCNSGSSVDKAVKAIESKDTSETNVLQSTLIEDGKFTVTKDEMVEAINTIDSVVYVPMEFKSENEFFYSGQITNGVKCNIVCNTDGKTIRAIQVLSESATAKDAGEFFGNLICILDPDNKAKNLTKILEKWDMENLKDGDTVSCVIDDMYYSCDYSLADQVVMTVMATDI